MKTQRRVEFREARSHTGQQQAALEALKLWAKEALIIVQPAQNSGNVPGHCNRHPGGDAMAPLVDGRTYDGKRGQQQSDAKPCPSVQPGWLQLEWSKFGKRGVAPGLRNIGTTCYLNSALQCLSHCVPLLNVVLSATLGSPSPNDCMVRGFCSICAISQHLERCFVQQHPSSPLLPVQFIRNMKAIARNLRPSRQEDAHEFMRFLLDALVKHGNQHRARLLAWIDRAIKKMISLCSVGDRIHFLFSGLLISSVQCGHCRSSSDTMDPFQDIAFDIRNCDSVARALQKFSAPDALTGSNQYFCSKCQKKTNSIKSLNIYSPPIVLTLQLKRFEFSALGGRKINRHVSFPEFLSIPCRMSHRTVRYRLFGVLSHAGHGNNSGHYFSFVRGPSGTWFRMDDEMVQQVKLSTVLSQQAYILFYCQPPEPGTTSHPSGPSKQHSAIHVQRPAEYASVPVVKELKVLGPLMSKNQRDNGAVLPTPPTSPPPLPLPTPAQENLQSPLDKLKAMVKNGSREKPESKEQVKVRVDRSAGSVEELLTSGWQSTFDVTLHRASASKRPVRSDLEYDEGKRKKIRSRHALSVFDRNGNPFNVKPAKPPRR